VLVADDDRVLSHLLAARLQALGWSVQVAMDAMQAVMFTKQSSPDIIVLDIAMPGGTGRQALTNIKSNSKTRGIPVIVVSGSIDEKEEEEVLALGAVEFIRKPVEPEHLEARLRHWLGIGESRVRGAG
jgi:CheY-like chemotaxis protein